MRKHGFWFKLIFAAAFAVLATGLYTVKASASIDYNGDYYYYTTTFDKEVPLRKNNREIDHETGEFVTEFNAKFWSNTERTSTQYGHVVNEYYFFNNNKNYVLLRKFYDYTTNKLLGSVVEDSFLGQIHSKANEYVDLFLYTPGDADAEEKFAKVYVDKEFSSGTKDKGLSAYIDTKNNTVKKYYGKELIREEEYDKDGNLLHLVIYPVYKLQNYEYWANKCVFDFTKQEFIFEYDSDGRMTYSKRISKNYEDALKISWQYFNELIDSNFLELWEETRYEYDSEGRPSVLWLEETDFSHGKYVDSLRSKTVISYYPDGNWEKKLVYEWFDDDGRGIPTTPTKVYSNIREYDSHGYPAKFSILCEDEPYKTEKGVVYDTRYENGYVISTAYQFSYKNRDMDYNPLSGSKSFIEELTYDSEGYLVRHKVPTDRSAISYTYEYDRKGRLTAYIVENTNYYTLNTTSYYPSGAVKSVREEEVKTGKFKEYLYNKKGQLTTLRFTNFVDSEYERADNYFYDKKTDHYIRPDGIVTIKYYPDLSFNRAYDYRDGNTVIHGYHLMGVKSRTLSDEKGNVLYKATTKRSKPKKDGSFTVKYYEEGRRIATFYYGKDKRIKQHDIYYRMSINSIDALWDYGDFTYKYYYDHLDYRYLSFKSYVRDKNGIGGYMRPEGETIYNLPPKPIYKYNKKGQETYYEYLGSICRTEYDKNGKLYRKYDSSDEMPKDEWLIMREFDKKGRLIYVLEKGGFAEGYAYDANGIAYPCDPYYKTVKLEELLKK